MNTPFWPLAETSSGRFMYRATQALCTTLTNAYAPAFISWLTSNPLLATLALIGANLATLQASEGLAREAGVVGDTVERTLHAAAALR